MKTLVTLSLLVFLLSCGKYERPFITFKSPEKRLTQTSWRCVKVVDEAGNEFEVFDQLDFSIDGSDSTFYRISEVGQFTSDYSGTRDTVQGNWTWGYALNGVFNKQLIKHTNPAKILKIISLSSKVLVFQDYTNNNSVYHYAPL
jgi:hypothetical protein